MICALCENIKSAEKPIYFPTLFLKSFKIYLLRDEEKNNA
jgi:hypothetical protein